MPTLADNLRGPIDARRGAFPPGPAPVALRQEQCELCAQPLEEGHQHLLEPAHRQLICACDACAILFSNRDGGKYRRVPRRIEVLDPFQMSDMDWAALGIPINLAFFFYSTPASQVIALYPSPGGATESALAHEPWEALVEANPALENLEPDVEALLVNRLGDTRAHYRAPIDECFKLVGLIRTHWRGLSGGAVVWGYVARFFEDLESRSAGRRIHG